MTDSINAIPLNKLTAWEGNVRRTGADDNLDSLAASIAAHGLLQSLIVRQHKKNRYEVIGGARRLRALRALAEAGKIAADSAIRCRVIGADANATEVSLAENTVRQPMHPADEFEAFLALIEDGMHSADIAARFGVTETVVQQRLKLARVSPAIVAAYRRGEIALAHVMAFAVSDDHAAQEYVFEALGEWQTDDPSVIRDALTAQEITVRERRVKFVTLKAYEKAGGAVRRDLFASDDDGVFIQDLVLLESLVAKKLEKLAKKVRAEGWKWVEVRPSFDRAEWSQCGRRYAELPPALEAELDRLTEECNRLWSTEVDEDNSCLDDIEDRIREIEDTDKSWTPETLSMAGAIVSIGYDGEADIQRGYVKREDIPRRDAKAGVDEESAATARERSSGPSAALIENLTAHRTVALAVELMERPDLALAVLVHTLAAQLFLQGSSEDTCIGVRLNRHHPRGLDGALACAALDKAEENWGSGIPGTTEALWSWCLEQKRDTLLELLAFCMARSINAVQQRHDRPGQDRLAHANNLAQAVDLDMRTWFTPTAGNYFGRISKTGILAALREAKGDTAPAWEKQKKADLANLAERELAQTGWLPEILRPVTLSGDSPGQGGGQLA